jgi:hypothetical protein
MTEPFSPFLSAVSGLALILGLFQFVATVLLTRRLGMTTERFGLTWALGANESRRLFKLMWGLESPPADARVGGLIWVWRGLQAGFIVAAGAVTILIVRGAV